MRRHALDLGLLFAGGTVAVLYVSLSQPALRGLALHVYVLLLGAITMFALVAATSDASAWAKPSMFERALAERGGTDERRSDLEKMQREVTLATSSAYDTHYRLVPHLREIARTRCERRGRRPGPETLGRWWELLRPDRTPPDERFSGGISVAELRACIDDLERI